MSVIYQDFALVQHLSVAENLFLGRELMSSFGLIDWRRTHAEARRLLDALGIDIPTNAKVSSLSVGQRQLVEIAKALGIDGKLLILDEPTASLSHSEAERLFALIRKLAQCGRRDHLRQSPPRRNRAARRSGDGAARRPFRGHLSGRSAGSSERRFADHRL